MRKLTNLYFELTGGCNLQCKHCYVFTTDKARERPDLLTPEIIEQSVSQGIDLGLRTLTFTGGEIFLRKDIREVLERCASYPVEMCLLTNLTLLEDSDIDWLSALPIRYVSTSIDGFESAHDSFRKSSGAFKKTMNALENLRSHNVPVKVSVTVGKHNIDQAKELFAQFDKMSIPTSIAKIVSIGRGKLIDIPDRELERRYAELLVERLGRELVNARDKDFGAPNKTLNTYCGVGDSILYIMSDGRVAYCPTLTGAQGNEWVVGSLLDKSLTEIWNFGGVFDQALQCEGNSTCEVGKLCRGGCRANAYAKTGKISACDQEMFDGITTWKHSHKAPLIEIVYLAT